MARIRRKGLSVAGSCPLTYITAAGLLSLSLCATALQQGPNHAAAQNGDAQSSSQQSSSEDYSRVDSNGDERLQWQEVRSVHGPALDQRGWDKRYVLDTFDHNGDEAFNQQEHRMLVVSLQVTDPAQSASAVGADSGAADSHLTGSVPGVVSNPEGDANANLAVDGRPIGEEQDSAQDSAVSGPPKPTVYDLLIGDLQGRRVVNARNQNVGKVKQLVVNPRTSELGLVVRSGGLLEIGSSDLLVEVDNLNLNAQLKLVWNTEQTAADLLEVAAYQQNDYSPVNADGASTLRSIVDNVSDDGRRQ